MTDTSDTQNRNKSLSQMKFKMFIFLAIVAVNIFAITRINAHIISQEKDLLRGINFSARQTMLTQRIPMLSSIIIRETVFSELDHKYHNHDTNASNLKDTITSLNDAITLMEISHKGLIYGSKDLGLPPAPQAYVDYYFQTQKHVMTEGGETLDDAIVDFIGDANHIIDIAEKSLSVPLSETEKKALFNGYIHISDHSFHDLLGRINESVFIYEQEGQKSLTKIQILEPILFGGSLVMLFIMWISVFRPMERQIIKNMKLLEVRKDKEIQNKNRFDLALQGTSTGVWDWSIKTDRLHCSQVIIILLGLKDHIDMTALNVSADASLFQSLLNTKDHRRFKLALIQHLKYNKPFLFEGQLKHEEGHWIWVRIRGQALYNDNNVAYRVLGSIEDITKIKKAERQANIFTYGIESAKIPFSIIDLKKDSQGFMYASRAFCDLVGYNEQKILSSNLNIFTGPETSMSALDQMDYAFTENSSLSIKVIHYKADGTAFWNTVTLEPIAMNNSGDEGRYFSIIFNDLTEIIAKEKQEVSRQRNESLGSLAGSVAHEINNLLMPMTMAKDMLEDSLKEDCDPFAHEQLDVMVDYANQAKNIVQGILTFSRKETKNIEKVRLYEELESSVQFIQNLMSSKTTLTLTPPSNDDDKNIEAMINTTEIKQIITNLCRNAEDSFNEKNGQITITIDNIQLSKKQRNDLDVIANNFSVIRVKDNGSGIDSAYLEQIFEPLFTTKDIGKGTGLGLSVVVGILRSWGGAITVDSVLGKGTTFEIYIPIHKNENDFNDLADLADEFSEDDFTALYN